jgi:hypothetical protein
MISILYLLICLLGIAQAAPSTEGRKTYSDHGIRLFRIMDLILSLRHYRKEAAVPRHHTHAAISIRKICQSTLVHDASYREGKRSDQRHDWVEQHRNQRGSKWYSSGKWDDDL